MGYGNYICPNCKVPLDPNEKCDCPEHPTAVQVKQKPVKIIRRARKGARGYA